MGEIVELQGKLPDKDDHEFVVDMARYAEGITDQKAIRKKYRMFDDAVWAALGEDDELVRAIEDEKIRRVRTGLQKKERSQHLITKAPAILDTIMCDSSASPRHRVDAIKTLDGFAAPPAEAASVSSDRFQITINLGADVNGVPIVEKYDKSIAIDVNDADDNGVSNTNTSDPQPDGTGGRGRGKLLTGFPTNKWEDDGAAQLDLFAEKPVKTERPDVHEIVRSMSAVERSALKSFLEAGE